MKRKPKPKIGKTTATLHVLAIEAQHFERFKALNPRRPPSNTRHIDPASPEGKAIAARLGITPSNQ